VIKGSIGRTVVSEMSNSTRRGGALPGSALNLGRSSDEIGAAN
jgi:hypothetical protein